MRKKFNLLIIVFAFSMAGYAQVGGTVLDGDGLPLPGVNVVPDGNQESTVTDFDGNFTLANTSAGTRITFSMIGYGTVTQAGAASMSVTLQEEASQIDEVVVVGFGTKKMGSITGSVSQIKAAEVVKTPAQSAIQAVQGKAAGVNIVATDDPGVNPTIRIRGLGTIASGREPLIIVDGVENNSIPNPNEVATIDILKDASSLAIYGQKGANGVIIVTTKKGKSGKPVIHYDTYYGQKFVQKKVDMAGPERYIYYNNYVQGSTSYFNPVQPYQTDWFDEITRTGEVMSHYLSVSGGSDNVTYYFGATNYKEKGILDGTQYERTNVNSRNEFKFWDGVLKVSPAINLEVSKDINKPNSAFTNAYKQSPIVPVRFENGRWGVPLRNSATGLVDINGDDRFNNVGNPVSQLYYTNDQARQVILSGSIAAELKLRDWLKFTSNFGARYATGKAFNFVPTSDIWLSQNPTQSLEDYEATFNDETTPIYNTLTQSRYDDYQWNWDNYFTVQKTFGSHDITGTLGMSRTTTNDNESITGTRRNVPEQSNYWSLSQGTNLDEISPDAVVNGVQTTPIVSIAYFARAEYSYADKYLLTALIRREGISAFQKGKQWENFPSISAGWVVSNESFLKDSKVLNYLKLRGGYGEVGNGRTGVSLNTITFVAGSNYVFGDAQSIVPGNIIPFAVDPNLTWETMAEVDFGLDFRTLDNRLSGTFDVYNRKSKNLIVPITPPLAISNGNSNVNSGEVVNQGVEASLRWDGKVGDDWKYWVSGNYSYNENELTKVDNGLFATYIGGGLGNGGFTKQVLVGQPLGTFYVYEVTGFDSNGQFTYSEDRVAAGSYIPKYTYGLSVGFTWKNVDFSADAYGVGGNKIYNGKKAQRFGGENIEQDYLDSFWTPSTPNAENPSPFDGIPRESTYFLEDGDYLRINNITVGYTLPKFSDYVEKVRIYATAINPFVFTKYSGFSPEVNGDGSPLGSAGVELDSYPTNKTFLLGINVTL